MLNFVCLILFTGATTKAQEIDPVMLSIYFEDCVFS
jgi:hypothetical protein